MQFSSLVWLPLLASLAAAVPGQDLFRREKCNSDNCYRAAVASSARPFNSKAAGDCSRFQTTTVTPCPVIALTTSTITVEASVSTVFASMSTVLTTTVLTTSSVFVTTTDRVTFTTTEPVTVTVSTTTTVIPDKRRDDKVERDEASNGLDRRVIAPACSPTSTSSTLVPAYASACSGVTRYASACSCAGITSAKVTASAVSITSIILETTTTTPVTTVIQTLTSTSTIADVSITTILDAIPTTVATTTISETTTVTTVVTETPAVCEGYKLLALAGPFAGQYVTATLPDPDAITLANLEFTPDNARALRFSIRQNGNVYVQNTFGWIVNDATIGDNWLASDRAYQQGFSGFVRLTCAISGRTDSFPAADGTWDCAKNGAPITLNSCTFTKQKVVQRSSDDVRRDECTDVKLVALRLC